MDVVTEIAKRVLGTREESCLGGTIQQFTRICQDEGGLRVGLEVMPRSKSLKSWLLSVLRAESRRTFEQISVCRSW